MGMGHLRGKRRRFFRMLGVGVLWVLNVPLIFVGVAFSAGAVASLVPAGGGQAAVLSWRSFSFWLALLTGLGLAFFPLWFCAVFTKAMIRRNEWEAAEEGKGGRGLGGEASGG